MAYPNFNLPFIIKSEASTTVISYVVMQIVDGKERIISYGSKRLSGAQKKWSMYDWEFWALVCAVRANAHYLRHVLVW